MNPNPSATAFTPALPLALLGDDTLRQRVQTALDQKTKPQGSLGRLEALALQRANWYVFRDRRPELYSALCTYDGVLPQR